MKTLLVVAVLCAGCAPPRAAPRSVWDRSDGRVPEVKQSLDDLDSLDPPVRDAVEQNYQSRLEIVLAANRPERAMTEALWLEGYLAAQVKVVGQSANVVVGPRFQVGSLRPTFAAEEVGDAVAVRSQMEKFFPAGSFPSLQKMKRLEVRLRVLRICEEAQVGLGDEDAVARTVPVIALCRIPPAGVSTPAGAGCPKNPPCRKFSFCEPDSNACEVCACP